jgi:hypothetical protein
VAKQGSERSNVYTIFSGARSPCVPKVIQPKFLRARFRHGAIVRIIHLQHWLIRIAPVREQVYTFRILDSVLEDIERG